MGPVPAVVRAVEYFHSAFDHYFVTTNAAEATGLPEGIPVITGTIDAWADPAGKPLRLKHVRAEGGATPAEDGPVHGGKLVAKTLKSRNISHLFSIPTRISDVWTTTTKPVTHDIPVTIISIAPRSIASQN